MRLEVYLGNDRKCVAQQLTATLITVTELMRKVEGLIHKLYMDNFFSSAEHFDDLTKTIIYFGTVKLNRKGMSED